MQARRSAHHITMTVRRSHCCNLFYDTELH